MEAKEVIKVLNQIADRDNDDKEEVEALTVAVNFCMKHDDLLQHDIGTEAV